MTNTPNPTTEAVLREQFERISDQVRTWSPGSTRAYRQNDSYISPLLCGDWLLFQAGHNAALATLQAAQPTTSDATYHAVQLEQCALFVDSAPLSRAMTEAGAFLRTIAAEPHPDTLDARTVELTDAECEVMARAFYNNGPGNVPYSTSYAGMRRAYAALRATAPQHKDAASIAKHMPSREWLRDKIAADPDDVTVEAGVARPNAAGVDAADAYLTALLRYTAEFYGVAMSHGVPAERAAHAVAHVESAARQLRAMIATSPAQGDALVARDAVREVVREAHWAMEDCESGDYKYEGTDHEYVRLPEPSFTRLNNALDALEALIPESEQPALVGHAVTVLWPPAPAAQGDAEPVAWRWAYTMPDGRDALWYWGPDKPTAKHALYGMPIRVEPLYAAPRPASDDARDAGRTELLATDMGRPAIKRELSRLDREIAQMHDDLEECGGMSGSPGEALHERVDELETELRKRDAAIARQPAKGSV